MGDPVTGKTTTFQMEIETLGASNKVTIDLGTGCAWGLKFQIKPESIPGTPATPLSISALSLSGSELSITAGSSPLSAVLIVTVTTPDGYLKGTTSSNDDGCHVRAQVTAGLTTDLMGDWTVSL